MRCPDCNQPFAEVGYRIHAGMKHQPKLCRYRGDTRGWCTVHDAEWRIDRRKCEASWDAIDEHFAALTPEDPR
jgi:hypothetical protein